MRRWIEYLITFEPAREDFLVWLEEQKTALTKKITEAAKSGETEKLQPLGIELGIYESIRARFAAEFRERQSQITREENRR